MHTRHTSYRLRNRRKTGGIGKHPPWVGDRETDREISTFLYAFLENAITRDMERRQPGRLPHLMVLYDPDLCPHRKDLFVQPIYI